MVKTCIAALIIIFCFQMVPEAVFESSDAVVANQDAEISRLVNALSGDSAVVEWNASQKLIELGDAAVPAVAQIVYTQERLAPRLVAVEILGAIGTKAAMDALLSLLDQERNLAVRSQICMQLGYSQEKRAVPVIARWLAGIGPSSLNDVPGPKEIQPSTCYIRHVEALGMIGDNSAVPILEKFRKRVPANIGYGGFISDSVTTAVDQALADIRDSSEFWRAVGRHDGLTEKIAPVFRHFRTNNLARLRLYEIEVLRRTKEGKVVLNRLAKHADPELAAAARVLLDRYDDLSLGE